MTVTSGEQANFPSVGNDVNIQWTVDGEEYESCLAVGGDFHICFENSYMSDTATTRTTLIIANSSRLGLGSYTVQCIVQQDLDPGFGTEPFQESRTASLYTITRWVSIFINTFLLLFFFSLNLEFSFLSVLDFLIAQVSLQLTYVYSFICIVIKINGQYHGFSDATWDTCAHAMQ